MRLSNMAAALRKYGLTVVVVDGFASRGYAGQDFQEVRGMLWHHTATNRARFAGADAPTLSMCTYGRGTIGTADYLPGPLCNIVFGRNGTVYLVAAGVANHAGKGSAPGVPKDAGNHYLIGIEMESSGVAPWDWTADQLRVAPILGAALELEFLGGLPAEERLQLGHLEYSSMGKIDPAGWPGGMDGLRAAINNVLTGTNEEDGEMSAAEVTRLEKVIVEQKGLILGQVWGTAEVIQKQNIQLNAKFDALVSALGQAAAGGDVDYSKVEEAAAAGALRALEEGTVRVSIDVEGVGSNG